MNPLLTGAIAVVLLGGVATGIYQAGKRSAERECNAASVRQELANVKADLEAAKKAKADADTRGLQIDVEAQANAGRVKELEDELAKKPVPGGCSWTADDARRGLRGDVPTGPRPRKP